jgi:flagellar motility protein MotE (MotC chaperone)
MTTKERRAAKSEVRLLPAVIGVGAILFGLKAAGIAFGATAATEPQKNQPATAQTAPAEAATASAKPAPAATAKSADPIAAINAALPMPPNKPSLAASENPPPAANSVPPELAGAGVSQAEIDVLTSLAGRRDTLDERQRELDMKASVLAATEKRIDEKIAQLKALQAKIDAVMGQRDTKEAEQLDGLVRVYTAMKPKDAARIFSSLNDDVRIGVAGRMKPDTMAGILAALPSDVAQKLTVELASRYKLLSSAASAATPTAAATPANTATPATPAPAAAAPPASTPAAPGR